MKKFIRFVRRSELAKLMILAVCMFASGAVWACDEERDYDFEIQVITDSYNNCVAGEYEELGIEKSECMEIFLVELAETQAHFGI